MKLMLDENIPISLTGDLRESGIDADSVISEGLAGASDKAVWDAAVSEGRILVTQDIGFAGEVRALPPSSAGLVLVKLRNPGKGAVIKRLKSCPKILNMLELSGFLTIITETKIRRINMLD